MGVAVVVSRLACCALCVVRCVCLHCGAMASCACLQQGGWDRPGGGGSSQRYVECTAFAQTVPCSLCSGYKACYHVSDVYQYDEGDVFPLGSIQLEGEVFPAPAKVEPALEGCYGSLKKGAKYNPATKKYEDPPAEGGPEPKKSKTTDA